MRYPGTLGCSRPPFQRGRKVLASLVELLGCKWLRLQMQIWRHHRSGVRALEDFALLFHGRMQRQHPVKLPIDPGNPNRPLCRQRPRPFSLAWLSHGSPPGRWRGMRRWSGAPSRTAGPWSRPDPYQRRNQSRAWPCPEGGSALVRSWRHCPECSQYPRQVPAGLRLAFGGWTSSCACTNYQSDYF